MNIVCKTDIGNDRKINQDYVGYHKLNENEAICVLCDGMGGHKAGEVASKMVGEYILENFTFEAKDEMQIQSKFNALLTYVNHYVYETSLTSSEYEGMGTTVVLAYLTNDNLYISHIGDSRAYLVEKNQLIQVTEDDTFVNELVKNGLISKEEALTHPQRNVLVQAVGVGQNIETSFKAIHGYQGLLLCSDGLYNSLDQKQILEIMNKPITINEKANQLINESNRLGGNDNISVLIAQKGENV